MSTEGRKPIISYQLLGFHENTILDWRSYGMRKDLFSLIRSLGWHRDYHASITRWKIVKRTFDKGIWTREEIIWQSNPDSISTD